MWSDRLKLTASLCSHTFRRKTTNCFRSIDRNQIKIFVRYQKRSCTTQCLTIWIFVSKLLRERWGNKYRFDTTALSKWLTIPKETLYNLRVKIIDFFLAAFPPVYYMSRRWIPFIYGNILLAENELFHNNTKKRQWNYNHRFITPNTNATYKINCVITSHNWTQYSKNVNTK